MQTFHQCRDLIQMWCLSYSRLQTQHLIFLFWTNDRGILGHKQRLSNRGILWVDLIWHNILKELFRIKFRTDLSEGLEAENSRAGKVVFLSATASSSLHWGFSAFHINRTRVLTVGKSLRNITALKLINVMNWWVNNFDWVICWMIHVFFVILFAKKKKECMCVNVYGHL